MDENAGKNRNEMINKKMMRENFTKTTTIEIISHNKSSIFC